MIMPILLTALAAEPSPSLPAFDLRDYRGKPYSANDFRDAKFLVVAFVGVDCPLARLYGPKLEAVAKQYADRGVKVVAFDANEQDSVTQLGHYARQHNLTIPLIKDLNNRIADALGATRTPEVFVLDGDRKVRFQGRIDDQYGIGSARDKSKENYLTSALDDLLAGRPVNRPRVEAVGCLIGKVKQPAANAAVTYSNQIVRLLQNRCVVCHRAGEIGPFALTSYEQARGWAAMIEEVVESGQMPPWHADAKYGHFANDRRLSDAEKQLVRDWVAAGAPEGDRAQLPPPRKFLSGWQLPKEPDQVVFMSDKPARVPAEGVVKYQYFVTDPKLTEDKWIKSVEVRPGDRAVVHHVLVFAAAPGSRGLPGEGGSRGFLAAYVPGLLPMHFPEGMAKKLPKGSRLVFQVHYTPIGSPREDRSSIAFVFADPKRVTHEVRTTSAASRFFRIPPRTADYAVEATSRPTPEGAKLLAFMPHMHLRGQAFRYEAAYPDGSREILLDVPRYDFNWQTAYTTAAPIKLPTGTKIHATAKYDNSTNNPSNPDPDKTVRWGDQTWDEMMIGYFDVAIPRAVAETVKEEDDPPSPEVLDRVTAGLKRLDRNNDGKLQRGEIPERWLAIFDRIDADKKGEVAIEEVAKRLRPE